MSWGDFWVTIEILAQNLERKDDLKAKLFLDIVDGVEIYLFFCVPIEEICLFPFLQVR